VRVSPDVVLGAKKTVLSVHEYGQTTAGFVIEGPEKTRMIDSLLQAQIDYQAFQKNDPAWIKKR
jgi:hypothetical protein